MNQRNKLQVRQFKNIKILTRNQAQAKTIPINHEPTKKTVVDTNIPIKSVELIPSSTQTKSQDNIHKRLKLKDYLHLNGIEKKNRSKSRITENSLSAKNKTQTSESQPNPKPIHETITQDTEIKVSYKKEPPPNEGNYTGMLREQILARIEQQKKKLTDLQDYLTKDFKQSPNMTDTFVFLFNIYNKMNQVHAINQEVGSSVVKYSKEEANSKGKGKLLKKMTYHWEDDGGELDSPAKIKSSNKVNFDIQAMLKMAK